MYKVQQKLHKCIECDTELYPGKEGSCTECCDIYLEEEINNDDE